MQLSAKLMTASKASTFALRKVKSTSLADVEELKVKNPLHSTTGLTQMDVLLSHRRNATEA